MKTSVSKFHALGDALDAANAAKIAAKTQLEVARATHLLDGTPATLSALRDAKADLEAARADFDNALRAYTTTLRQYADRD